MTGWPRRLRTHAALAVAGAIALPWLAGEFAKGFIQPGLADDAHRRQLLVDFIVIGSVIFLLTMVATWLIGCWITAVMKGPVRRRDAFPGAPGEPPA